MASTTPMMAWFNVPGGSTFQLDIEASDDKYQILGTRTKSHTPNVPLGHTDIVPSYTISPLTAPEDYGLSLEITFLGPAETTVTLTGQAGGKVRTATASGANGLKEVILISIMTK